MDNSIGAHKFLALLGNVVPPREQLLPPVQRPGVDGTGIRKAGSKGSPFMLISQVDLGSMDEARAEAELYKARISGDPVALVVDDFNFNTEELWKVKVWDVRIRKIHEIAASTGGLNDPGGAFLECEWQLIAIAN